MPWKKIMEIMAVKSIYPAFLLLSIALLFSVHLGAVNAEQGLPDSAVWLELRDNYSFDPFAEDTGTDRNIEYSKEVSGENELIAMLRFLLALAILALMLYGVIVLIRRHQRNQKIKISKDQPELYFKNIEENIAGIDLNLEIQKAVNAGQYDIAVRLWYLQCLKTLSTHNVIKYRLYRPNGEFVSEMASHPGAQKNFHGLTVIFDAIRYGNRTVSAQEYNILASRFQDFYRGIPEINNQQ